MEENEKLKGRLVEKLKNISQDKEFILSIINLAWHVEDRRKVIAFIDDGIDVTYENVLLLALTLYEEREKE